MERLGSMAGIEAEPAIASYLMDMDGVLVRGAQMIPGAVEFIVRLRARGLPFLILTNNSLYSPRDLQARLSPGGVVPAHQDHYNHARATAIVWTPTLSPARRRACAPFWCSAASPGQSRSIATLTARHTSSNRWGTSSCSGRRSSWRACAAPPSSATGVWHTRAYGDREHPARRVAATHL